MLSHYLHQSSLVISSLFRHYLPSLRGSQRLLDMCTARAEYVIGGRFVTFSSLSPFGGSGAYRINDSPHSPSPREVRERFSSHFLRHSLSSFVISLFFPSHFPYCLWPKAYHLFLFLSPRNPLFAIFCIAVLYYESTTYIPFLYQSSKILISFL